MPRLRQVGRDDAHPFAQAVYAMLFGDRDPVEQPGTATGTPGNWWTVFALVPDAFDHTTAGFQFYRSPDRRLAPRLRELGQIRAGWAVGSRFVFSQHCKACRDVGFTDEQVAAIPSWQVADCFAPIERAVLAYTDALVLQHGRVPDAVFDALRAELSDEEILELTYVTATYMMHAVMSRALRLEYDDVDDPVTEVADPSGRFGGLDVMAMVDTPDDAPDDAPEDADGG
jgi:alkylhydroperoxidase family enzyme